MLKELKWKTLIVIMALSLLVLFGGWFIYQNFSIKNPMIETLSSIDGVEIIELEIDRDLVKLNITLDKVDDFQATYYEIQTKIQPYLKKRQLDISIENKISRKMIEAWNRSYFYIAEGIDQHQYSIIPETIESLKLKLDLDKADYSMDEKNIYIDLHQDKYSLYVILPRDSVEGVKSLG